MNEEFRKRRKRLTHEQPEGMYESLHNTAFVKGKEVYLRGMGENGKDISLCAYCAAQCKERCGTDLTDISTEEFGEFMDCECPVSTLYAIAIGAAEMREKLSRFEDAEENGAGLNDLAAAVHENAVAHGWWEEERHFGSLIALMHSELSEALEEFRSGKPPFYFITEIEDTGSPNGSYPAMRTDIADYNGEKPEGVAVELADCIIRILDYCGKEGIDIETAIRIKHEYNKSRPYRHGGKKC